ncbi:hypothetical protein KKA47_06985 [bacterium]|nr:hypothetical protein [bacterium]
MTEKMQLPETVYSSEHVPFGTYSPRNYYSNNLTPEYIEGNSRLVIAVNMEVRLMVVQTSHQQDVSLMQNVMSSLLHNRDFLGYQLSYYKGNLTEEQFEIVKNKYLISNNIYDVNALASDVSRLMNNTSIIFDSDEISTIFRCDINLAEDALTKIMNSLNI